LGIIIGLAITLGCMLGGFIAMGGHVSVLIQPWEFVIILGAALGTFFVANPFSLVKDTGRRAQAARLSGCSGPAL
jgi:chemotaxis protein MotA